LITKISQQRATSVNIGVNRLSMVGSSSGRFLSHLSRAVLPNLTSWTALGNYKSGRALEGLWRKLPGTRRGVFLNVTIQHLSTFSVQSRLKPALRSAGFSRLCAPVVRDAFRLRAGAGWRQRLRQRSGIGVSATGSNYL
jgi:hypothetical protein